MICRELRVAEIVLHKDFDYNGRMNDIALLKTGLNNTWKSIFCDRCAKRQKQKLITMTKTRTKKDNSK